MFSIIGKYTSADIFIDQIDDVTYSQIEQLVNHPSFTQKVSIMPDTHAGAANSVIGFTMPLSDSLIPNTVGVDIGCGMLSARIFANKENLDLKEIDNKIRKVVPIGNRNGTHKNNPENFAKSFPFEKASDLLHQFTQKLNIRLGANYTPIEYNYPWFEKLCKRVDSDLKYTEASLGTLGGGNHFIEIGESSQDQSLWITFHSGSRKIGGDIAKYHSHIAAKNAGFDQEGFKKEFERIKAGLGAVDKKKLADEHKKLKSKFKSHYPDVPNQMEFLSGQLMYDYLVDMIFAQFYAQTNRLMMLRHCAQVLKADFSETIESTHNYIDPIDLIIRKGAIRAYKTDQMIIPFNMADGILICKGKSNPLWNYSAPHGAGRIMSRNKAKENISMKDYENRMKMSGVFSSSINTATLDEAPQAYKSAAIIEKAIEATAEILFRLKPIYNLKAGN
jgi:RNA-splicing ligase RtcB